jgi:hypothetical protein|tara:strand:- start:27 stop:368 length:342 start_codon:yes stop_codon:yes gene_type:complete
MKNKFKTLPREFKSGINNDVVIKDMGTISLSDDEQITFLTDSNAQYDLARKSWGFYATPSVNYRLKKFNFKTAIVKNTFGKYFIMIVEIDKMDKFLQYLKKDNQIIIEWIDER